MGKTLKRLCGSVLTGAALRSYRLLLANKKITKTYKTDLSDGSREKTEESEQNSIVGGAVWGGTTYLLAHLACKCIGEDALDVLKKGDDNLTRYVDRIQHREQQR